MVRKNLVAWDIDINDYSNKWVDLQKLLYFARFAILAPSGHNTQPWIFKTKDTSLILSHNSNINLAHSGKLAAEPYVSIGSCLETFVLAARAFGYEIKVLPNSTYTSFELKLGKKITKDIAIAKAIIARTSNRKLYDTKPVESSLLHKLSSHNLDGVSLVAIQNKEQIEFLAEQTDIATRKIMSDPGFRKELSHWVRNNLTKKYNGMPGYAQEMPTPPSLVARHVITYFDVSKTQAKIDSKRVIHSPAILLLLAHDKKPMNFLNVGRLYAHTCITAQLNGYATSGVGAAAIDLDTKQNVRKQLSLSNEPTAMIRIGKTEQVVKHTPRFTLEQVLV